MMSCKPFGRSPSFADDESHDVDDFVGVCLTVHAIESRKNQVDEDELFELLHRLAFITHVEAFRRNGWLEFTQPLSLHSDQPGRSVSVRITDDGMKAGEHMRVLGKSLLH
jgi:hypothetical protein